MASSKKSSSKPFAIGDYAQAGEIRWRIEKEPDKFKELYGDYDSKRANGIFIFIELTGEMTGVDSLVVSTSEFLLTDKDGAIYETTNNGEEGLVELDRKTLSREQLNPGVPITGWIVFDIEEDATGLILEAGDLVTDSDESVFIDLGV